MKKLFFSLSFVFLAALTASAQSVGLGFKAGLNVASVNFVDESTNFDFEPDPVIGFHAGGFADIMLVESFGIRGELMYSQQGYAFENDIFGETTVTYNYVNIPVLLQYRPISTVNLHFGPQLGLFLAGNADTSTGDFDVEDIEPVSVALAFGGGLNFGPLVLDLRYNLGLTDINSANDDANSDGTSQTNQVLQLSVGFKFM